MSVAGATAAGQAAHELLMTDTCEITRPGVGDPTFDEATGLSSPPPPVIVYPAPGGDGRCKMKEPRPIDREITGGEHMWTVLDSILSLPIAAVGVRVDDTVTITASELDPDLPGRVYTVMGPMGGSQVTARRLIVRQVTS